MTTTTTRKGATNAMTAALRSASKSTCLQQHGAALHIVKIHLVNETKRRSVININNSSKSISIERNRCVNRCVALQTTYSRNSMTMMATSKKIGMLLGCVMSMNPSLRSSS